jgi:hypothetical protein
MANRNEKETAPPAGESRTDEPTKPAPPTTPIDLKAALADALKAMPADELAAILRQAQVVPTTMGMDAATVRTLIEGFQATSTTAVRETLRQERKENPNYPERSVFNPAGVYDDLGNPLPPKVRFRRPTIYVGVRLGGELETPEEIELCNRITESKTCHNGDWSATIEDKGTPRERLLILVPSKTADDRSGLPPFTHILRALIDGDDAINPETMHQRITALEQQIKAAGLTPATV